MTEATTAPVTVPVAVDPEGIPDYLKVRPQFVGWKAEPRPDGAIDKIPMMPGTNRCASHSDLMTWGWFDKAYEAYLDGTHDGIGFVFCSGDPFVGLDFDGCRDPETGTVRARILEYIERFANAYVEVSVSGKGIHLITRGKLQGGAKKGGYEIYDQDRFFALTGVAP